MPALIHDDSGQLETVRVVWTSDDFCSLMSEDFRLDGIPDADRLRDLAGKDLDWAAGFPGHILSDRMKGPEGARSPCGDPCRWLHHDLSVRPLTRSVPATDARPLLLRLHEPEYFLAYDTPRQPTVEGRADCRITRSLPDTTGQGELPAALRELDFGPDSPGIMNMADVGINCRPVRGRMWPTLILAAAGAALVLLAQFFRVNARSVAWATVQQREFQNGLARGLRAIKAGDAGAWIGFIGPCGGYAFLHAVGPGHGRLAMGAYGIACPVATGPLVMATVAASLGQALTAVILIAGGTGRFALSRQQMTALA